MRNERGFTLIEVIIYLALLSIIFGGVAVAVYSILENAGRDASRIQLQTEGDFIMAKINWALLDASSMVVSGSSTQISINKYLYNSNPIIFSASSSKIIIQEGSMTPESLNNDNVVASNLIFQDLPANNQIPEGVMFSFLLTSAANQGQKITQSFQETRYLAK